MKRIPTARQIAQRRNARLSRGPITFAGIAKSSQNALRHGLCAQLATLPPDTPLTESGVRHRIHATHQQLLYLYSLETGILANQPFSDATPALLLLNRYEARLSNLNRRARRLLLQLTENAKLPNDPKSPLTRSRSTR